MPPRPRRSSSRSVRRPRRRLIWAQRTATLAMTANAQWFTVDLLQEYKAATGASAAGVTVMRTHGWIVPTAVAANDTFWCGFCIGDLNDITGPTTNALVPNPHDNPYIDWMFAKKFLIDGGGLAPNEMGCWSGAIFDLRAKRRMEEVQQAYTFTLYQDTVTTVAKSYQLFTRTLLALP